ncbi:MAG: choice-of-anchor J domain-containing protein [Bacteroidales bacterium]|jgi:hypothetical protein
MRSLTIFSTILFFCIGSLIAQEKTIGNSIFGAREPIPQTDQSVTRTKSASATVIPESPAETSTLLLSEGFDDITNLPGWVMVNNSEPAGITDFFQGTSLVFPAFDGAPEAYIGSNYENTAGTGTISNWLISPELALKDGDVISFYTRTIAGSMDPDRLQLRLSLSGASTDVGATALSTGDFNTLLMEVNPLLTVGGYPETWTKYTVTLAGIPVSSSGRFALRYYVTNGGPTGENSNYIGIDRVEYKLAPVYTFPINEGFNDITSLPGWMMINKSEPLGLTNFFQGNSIVFPAYDGDPDAYIGANFNNTSGAGTISNWLISPELALNDGDVISFYTRTIAGSSYPDRLQLRLSLSGTSTDVGATALSTGDFITLLLEVNPLLTVGGYPETWSKYTVTLTGIPVSSSGRFALRYYVTNGGPTGENSNYIGIDRVVYASVDESGDEPVNIPVGNQAILLGVILMITFAVFRFRKML